MSTSIERLELRALPSIAVLRLLQIVVKNTDRNTASLQDMKELLLEYLERSTSINNLEIII